jgi:uncharacterized protein
MTQSHISHDALTSPAVCPDAAPILTDAAECLRQYYGARFGDLTVERVVVGVFFTGVKLSNGCAGVAYTPPEAIQRASTRILKGQPAGYRGRRAADLLDGDMPRPFDGIVRLATLNALSVPILADHTEASTSGDDLSAMERLFVGRRICMVGAIIPLLRRLEKLATAEIIVVDKKKETQSEASLGRFVPVTELEAALAGCETAVFTGASIANGSFTYLLDHVAKGAAVAVVGPTAAFVPQPLFRRGVQAVGTSVVTDADRALEILAEGGGAYQLFGNCVRKINLMAPA